MILSGENYILTPKTQDMSFVFEDVIINNTGIAEIGFSGAGNKFFYLFSGGRLIDPNDNFVYTLVDGESVTISGNIGGAEHRYYIDDELVSDGKGKPSFAVEKFYTKSSSDCQIKMGLKMAMPEVVYGVNFNPTYMAGGVLHGHVANQSPGVDFTVLDSDIQDSSIVPHWTGYVTGNVPAGGQLDFELVDVADTTAFQTSDATLSLKTTIGNINATITSSRASGVFWNTTTLSILQGIPATSISSPFSGSGNYSEWAWTPTPTQEKTYNIKYSVLDENGLETSKPIYIALENSGTLSPDEMTTGEYVYKWLTYDSGCHYCTGGGANPQNAVYDPCDFRVGSGSYSGVPNVIFSSYSRVTGISFNSNNIFSYETPEKIPIYFSGYENAPGTGASGYFLTEPFQLNLGSQFPHGDGINWRRITGYEITNQGTGYTKMPAVHATTGVPRIDTAGEVLGWTGYTTATGPNGLGTGYDVAYEADVFTLTKFQGSALGDYDAGYLTGIPYFNHTGNGVYGFSGVIITNPGSGYNNHTYKPKISFIRQANDPLGERGHCSNSSHTTKATCLAANKIWWLDGDNASGEFLWNEQGATYDFDTAWNIETGYYSVGIKTGEVDFKASNLISNNKYSSYAMLPAGQDDFYLTLKFNNLNVDETISSSLIISGSGVIKEVSTSAVKSYNISTGMGYLNEGNYSTTQGGSFLSNYFS